MKTTMTMMMMTVMKILINKTKSYCYCQAGWACTHARTHAHSIISRTLADLMSGSKVSFELFGTNHYLTATKIRIYISYHVTFRTDNGEY